MKRACAADIPAMAIVAGLTLLISVTHAAAGGFALKERSAKGQGLSFAGVTAGSAGISSAGFNPAAFGMIEHAEASAGIAIVSPISDGEVFTGGVSTGEMVDADRIGFVPNTYVGYRLSPEVVAGIAVTAPFGLKTEYPDTWTGAGDGILSDLLVAQISPTIAFQPVDNLSVGVSLNIIYADATLDSAVIDLSGDKFAIGFGLGAIWEPFDGTRIGLAYQLGYDLTLEGTGTPNAGPLAGIDLPLSADASLPSTISLGIVQEISDDIRVMGEVQWQNWSVFDAIAITLQTPLGPSVTVDPQNYNDAFFVALGGEYDATDMLTLRAGVAWDETPTSTGILPGTPPALGITNRTVRVPDGNRLWLSPGATYAITDAISVDAGYSYLYSPDDPVVGLRTVPGTSVVYDGGAHIFAVGGTIRF